MRGISKGVVATQNHLIARTDTLKGATNPGIYCAKKDATGTLWFIPAAGNPTYECYGSFYDDHWYGHAKINFDYAGSGTQPREGLCKVKASTGVVQWVAFWLSGAREVCFLADRIACFTGNEYSPTLQTIQYDNGFPITTKQSNEIVAGYYIAGVMGMASDGTNVYVVLVKQNSGPSFPNQAEQAKLVCLSPALAVLWSVDLRDGKDAISLAPRIRLINNKIWVAGANINKTEDDYSIIYYNSGIVQTLYGFLGENSGYVAPGSPPFNIPYYGGVNLDYENLGQPFPEGHPTKFVYTITGSNGWIKAFDKNTGVMIKNISTGNFPVYSGALAGSKESCMVPQYMFPGNNFFAVLFRGAQTTNNLNYTPGYLSSDTFSSYQWNDITIKIFDYDGVQTGTSTLLGKTYPQQSTDNGTVPSYSTPVNGTFLGKFFTVMNGAAQNFIIIGIEDLVTPNTVKLYKVTSTTVTYQSSVSSSLSWEGSQAPLVRGFNYPDLIISGSYGYFVDANHKLQRLGLSV